MKTTIGITIDGLTHDEAVDTYMRIQLMLNHDRGRISQTPALHMNWFRMFMATTDGSYRQYSEGQKEEIS